MLLNSTTQPATVPSQPNAVAELLTEHLLDAIKQVSTIIDSSSHRAITRLVRLHSTGGKLTVSAVNLDHGIFYAKTIPVWHGYGEFDVCTFPEIATPDLPDHGLGDCTIRHEETGKISFFFGGAYIYDPNADKLHIPRFEYRFRVKYLTQPGADFPAPPVCADVPAVTVNAAALRRAIDFAADGCDKQSYWDAAKLLHITVDADALTIRGTSGDALHKSVVPCVRLVDRAVTLAVWPDALKKLITMKGEITLYIDNTDAPTQVAVKLEDGTLALTASHADRLRGIDESTSRLWTLKMDVLPISTLANKAHKDADVRINFPIKGAMTLRLERDGDEQREMSVPASGLHPGDRQIVVSAAMLKKAFKHFDKAPLSGGKSTKKNRDLKVTLRMDALHPLIVWSARDGDANLFFYHQSLEATFPIVGLPARAPKYPVSFERLESTEDELQRRDHSEAFRDYDLWERMEFPLAVRVDIDDRKKHGVFTNLKLFGTLGDSARVFWHKADDGDLIAAYTAIYGEAAP